MSHSSFSLFFLYPPSCFFASLIFQFYLILFLTTFSTSKLNELFFQIKMLFFCGERSLPLVNKNLKSNYRTTTECLKEEKKKKVNQFVRDEEKGKVLSKNEAGFCLQATQSCILCWKRKWIDTWRDNSLHPSSWRDNYNFHSRTQQFLNNDNSHFRLSTIFYWNIARKFNFQLRRQFAVRLNLKEVIILQLNWLKQQISSENLN